MRGDYLIFDFGLSKELKQKDLVHPPDGFEATGLTGSRRYMAPEVVKCKNYGFSSDVYSFAILFWEVFSLRIPFDRMTLEEHFGKVVLKGRRPGRLNSLPKQLQFVMEECWSPDPAKRPRFKAICEQLRAEIALRGKNGQATKSVYDRTAYLMKKSDASRADSIKECC